ncbi:MAG: NAD-dependent epimerase/dehydratase family protein [Pseudolabrys sp.]
MLRHNNTTPVLPHRVVILGSRGFVGGAIMRKLSGAQLLGLSRQELDLLVDKAGERLSSLLRPDDALVIVSAIAPCKTYGNMMDNIRMMATVCDALMRRPVAHLVYISSDAVYADLPVPLTETSPAAPGSLHGAMHLAREQMLIAAAGSVPFVILRPTLIYGARDPHNGYGPNKFRRQANRGEDIVLFGDGEERRDHVDVDDLAELVRLVLAHRSAGILNVATGNVASFKTLAERVVALSPRKVEIKGSQRPGPMPHNGYRPFDAAAPYTAFPDFKYTKLDAGLARAQAQEFG